MSVLALIVILAALGVAYWLVNVKFGGALGNPFKWLINAVLIIVAIILVLMAFGVWQEVRDVQVPKI